MINDDINKLRDKLNTMVKNGEQPELIYEVSKELDVFDDETYTQNAEYVPSPSNVYIRGTMNGWGLTDLMNKTVVDGDIIFTKDISGSSSVNGKFEFKFDTGSWAEGQNWGLKSLNVDELSGYVISNGNNITVSGINSSKTYTFTFNFTDLTFSVKEKLN